MKKNLKKAISAVVAFALTASSAAFAAPASFTDVADTANYAEAVNTLAALGVISGYEDGTFKPDDKITRAEVSTMIVAAINRTADAQNQMGTTKFADMNNEAKKWASGYVNVAATENIIAGFEDGTFKPDEQVTYTQVVKMLVCAAGYDKYAEYLGGWPNGYLSVGSDKGVTKNVAAGQDEAVSRAQVAQMIYNTLVDVPLVAQNGFTVSETTGSIVPSLKVMDGKEGRNYETLLTEKHNAYVVEGYVSATNKSNNAICDADEVEFTIQYTENYDDNDIVVAKNQDKSFVYPTDVMNVGNTDAADYLLTYATAIVKMDENDDPVIVSFAPSGKNKVVEFDASLVLYENDTNDEYVFVDGQSNFLKYYPTKSATKATKYSLEKDFDDISIYVNGVKVETNLANLKTYVLENKTGKVQLIDTYSAQSKANGYYDAIFVTYYATASVDSINTNSKKIVFSDFTADAASSVTLDTESDDELVYNITLNGEAIELAALKEDDVVSIAYDVKAGFTGSKFYDILVSRDVAEGKYTGKSTDDETVTVGGTAYETVNPFNQITMDLSDEYTLYLDTFGRIYKYEKLASSAKYAIIDKYVYSSTEELYKATLYTADGTTKTAFLDDAKAKVYGAGENSAASDANAKALEGVYVNDNSGTKNALEDRVVTYKISSSTGYITELKFIDDGKRAEADFRTTTKTVGSVKMSDATKVINAIDYVDNGTSAKVSDLKTSSVSAFTADTTYTVYGFDKNSTDGTYSFVIVTAGEGAYNADTMIAVIAKAPEKGTEDSEDEYRVTAYYGLETADEDAEKVLVTNDEIDSNIETLAKGDVVVFTFDGDSKIDDYEVILSANTIGGADFDYDTIRTNAEAGSVVPVIPTDAKNWSNKWMISDDNTTDKNNSMYINTAKDVTRLVYGPIVAKKDSYFTLGSYSATKTTDKNVDMDTAAKNTVGGTLDINLTSETRVYVYDFSLDGKARLKNGAKADIIASTIPNVAVTNDVIDWTNAEITDVNFAFAKVVDGDATDVFVILAD